MKFPSDSSGGGDEPRPPAAPAATGVGGSPEGGEPSKKQRTEEPSPSSTSVAGECSSSSSLAPPPPPLLTQLPQDPGAGEPAPPPPGPESGGGGEEEVRVPDLGEDLVFEVLMRAEARTLAAAACVSRGWRALARDELLWEAACVRDSANTGYSEQELRRLVLSIGGFRRLHERYIRPVQRQRRAAGAPQPGPGQQQRRQVPPVRMSRDQLQASLGLLATSFFLQMPNAPPPPPKDKDGKDGDKNGGGQCG